jgi:flagellar protein FlgJ
MLRSIFHYFESKGMSVNSIPSQRSLNFGRDAFSAPISPAKQMPQVDRSKVDPKILEAAEGMEGMFLDYMMKVMRESVPKNEMDLESPASNVYRSMLDSEYAKQAAHHGGIGLADQIIAYLDNGSLKGYPNNVEQTKDKEKP